MNENKLPQYKITIDDVWDEFGNELGITQVAFVEEPAILTKGLAFNNDKMLFKDELLYRVASPALIPNLPIYRFDHEMGEYEVVFTEECVEKLRTKFMADKGNVVFNLDHDSTQDVPAYILDSWITVEPENDPSFTKYGIKVPKGSWFVVSQFTDKEYFKEKIIDGDRGAYSIEGFLGLTLNKIKDKLNKEKMEEKNTLPDGEHTIVVKDGEIVEVIGAEVEVPKVGEEAKKEEEEKLSLTETLDQMAKEEEEEKEYKEEEEKLEEVKEEEEEKLEEKEEEEVEEKMEEVDTEAAVAEVMSVIEPKFEEIYTMIAELKNMIEVPVEEEEEFSKDIKLSKVDVLNNKLNALRNINEPSKFSVGVMCKPVMRKN